MPDQFDPDPRLQAILDRLTTYYPRAIDPGLERTFRLLHDLGDPHKTMPPVIHVGGTNGKGSTLAYLRAMVEAAGKTCHVMTSPHLVRFNERLVIAGQQIATPDLIDLMTEVEEVNNGQETTSFELITAAGFLAFSRKAADVSLIEVGMGGRFDATNVIPAPLASVITVISRDHVQFLGNELSAIAFEKAGIMKAGAPCIIGPQTAEGMSANVMTVFEDVAAERDVPLYRHGIDWSYDVLPDRLVLHTPHNIYDLPKPNLVGDHQYGNAATAAMTLLTIGDRHPALSLPLSAYEYGMTHASWMGRLQKLTGGSFHGPLVDRLPPSIELWIDGGHNDSCGLVLGAQADRWAAEDGKPLHVILGMLNTKNPTEFARYLLPKAASVQAITIPDQPLSLSAEALGEALEGALGGISHVPAASSVEEAVAHILAHAGDMPCRILITGSLYLMGHILQENAQA